MNAVFSGPARVSLYVIGAVFIAAAAAVTLTIVRSQSSARDREGLETRIAIRDHGSVGASFVKDGTASTRRAPHQVDSLRKSPEAAPGPVNVRSNVASRHPDRIDGTRPPRESKNREISSSVTGPGNPAPRRDVAEFGRTGSMDSLSPEQMSAAATPKIPLVYQLEDADLQERFPDIAPAVMDAIRNEFERHIGAGELAVSDPEYARRWNRAEPTALERMRTLFGWAAVAEFERRIALETASGRE